MSIKQEIINKICYTELVYARINKKLKQNLGKKEIEELVVQLLSESDESFYVKTGKNYYVTNFKKKIRVTINSYTFRIITVDKII